MSMGIGRIVHYVLTAQDEIHINRRRVPGFTREGWPEGAQAHVGNPVSEGQHLPMIVTAVWPNEFGDGVPGINGQVFLDGNDSFWVTSAKEGTDSGQWHWPERD